MKKYGTFILSLIIITLYSCDNGTTATSAGKKNDAEAAIEQPNDTALCVRDTVPIDSHVPDSPKMILDIILTEIALNNDTATAKAISEISYILMGDEESKSIAETGNRYIAKLKAEYMELRPDYINIRENNENPFWLNHEYSVSTNCITGHKGIVNYCLSFYDFEGGAHPHDYKIAINLDPDDGHEVTIGEIMKPGYEKPLLEHIIRSIMSYLKVESVSKLNEIIFDVNNIYISKNVIIGKENLTFIYNVYDIAPYAVGEIIAEIPYEKLQDILKQEYK